MLEGKLGAIRFIGHHRHRFLHPSVGLVAVGGATAKATSGTQNPDTSTDCREGFLMAIGAWCSCGSASIPLWVLAALR